MYEADKRHGKNVVLSALHAFRCELDKDIETFLHTKAINFLERKLCSVYLILNEDLFLENQIRIEAYFTLSHKTITSGALSGNKIKKLVGFKDRTSLHFVLIGQLGKHIEINEENELNKSEITAREILDLASEVIYQSSSLIPCKLAMVECSDEPGVMKVYTDYGFEFLQTDGGLNQLIKHL